MSRKIPKPLPRIWSGQFPGIFAEGDIPVRHRGKLYAKLLIFKNQKAMREFSFQRLGHVRIGCNIGSLCDGFVNCLSAHCTRYGANGKPVKTWTERDPRYFCVIALIKSKLKMEIICHEATHAGICYARRIKNTPWKSEALGLDEESICYPAGRIAAGINRFLWENGLWK